MTQMYQTPQEYRDETLAAVESKFAPEKDDANKEAFFEWMKLRDWPVAHQHIARTMLSTWIERRLKARDGVFFNNPTTCSILIAREKPVTFTVPGWMTDWIESFPKAKWTIR